MLTRYHSTKDRTANPDDSHAVFILRQSGFVVFEGPREAMRIEYLTAESMVGAKTVEERVIAVYLYDGIGDLLRGYSVLGA